MNTAGSGSDDQSGEALLESLFHEALALAPRERAAYLAAQCAGDPQLLDELSTLLAAHAQAPTCLERPAWGLGARSDAAAALERDTALIGQRIGPYHVLALLGEGGMGQVYLAHQSRPLRRLVALKLVKLGMDSREVLARFDAERKVLARLNHPGIAAVHEAGMTPDGRPWFAMEYVAGERIATWCDEHRLDVSARLALFALVCDAVQHAHQKGVIHRDLKPSNVLVTEVDGRPQPKIIDFGVALAMQGDGRVAGTRCTREGQLIGTPGYMSPEQAGETAVPVDSRTDVFSLGVLLAELLTGVLPWELPGGGEARADWRRPGPSEAIRPSLRVAALGARARKPAMRRGLQPRQLERRLRIDLDWIVLKALQRDPEARYASAAQLAADVRSHLAGEPVVASSPGSLERLTKLVRRHRRPVFAGAALLGAALTGLLGYALDRGQRVEQLQQEVDRIGQDAVAADARASELLEVCDAARLHDGLQPAFTRVLVRNRGERPLATGAIVSLLGLGDEVPTLGPVLDVLPAVVGDGRLPLGAAAGSALRLAQDGHGGHGHSSELPIAPGALGWVATHGPLVPVRVDAAGGALQPNDRLGLSTTEGLAVRYDGRGPSLGFALDGWDGPGTGLVLAWLSPESVSPAEPDPVASGRLARPSGAEAAGAASAVEAGRWNGGREPGGATPLSRAEHTGTGAAPDGAPFSGFGVPLVAQAAAPPGAGGAGTPPGAPSAVQPEALSGKGDAGQDDEGGQLPKVPGPAPTPWEHGSVLAGTPADVPSMGAEPRVTSGQGDAAHHPGSEKKGGHDDPPPPQGTGVAGGGSLALEIVAPGNLPSDLQDDDEDGDVDTPGSGGAPGSDGSGGGSPPAEPAWGDVDGDGLLDVLLPGPEGARLLRGLGGGQFEDVSSWCGLAPTLAASSLQWLDYDGDGRLDLLSVGSEGALHLQRGLGQCRLQDATLTAGLSGLADVAQVAAFDCDSDTRPDLRVTTRQGALWLLVNDGTGRFRQVSLRAPTAGTAVDGIPSSGASEPGGAGAPGTGSAPRVGSATQGG